MGKGIEKGGVPDWSLSRDNLLQYNYIIYYNIYIYIYIYTPIFLNLFTEILYKIR